MKKVLIVAAIAGLVAATPALAKHHRRGMHKAPPGVEILERDGRGRATKIRKDGQEYAVCTSDNSDSCINPRDAGLGWGNYNSRDWPGRPISREN